MAGVETSAGAGSLAAVLELESSSCERRHRSDMLELSDVDEESLDIGDTSVSHPGGGTYGF